MTLLIMAAGMGSRYGGIKQIEPVGAAGELIIDYSIYDAILAGFEKVIFVIRRDIEKDFREAIFDRIQKKIKAEYVFQELGDLPVGFKLPEGRKKPWGTAQAIWAARGKINEPFCVINADDFYGREAYEKIAGFFKGLKKNSQGQYALVAYKLAGTISEQGTVSRGICKADNLGNIVEINERLKIEKRGGTIGYIEGESFTPLASDSEASMNFWGFTPDLMPVLEQEFKEFLTVNINDPKAEYPIPVVIGKLLKDKAVTVNMLKSRGKWLGFTYPEDKAVVMAEIKKLAKAGIYPTPLWK